MSSDNEETELPHVSPFESIRQESEEGIEFWSARDLAKILGYALWQKFRNVIEKAETACNNSNHAISDHFIHVDKMIKVGKAKDIHARKSLQKNQEILDFMGSDELAANIFRASQTKQKLEREQVKGKDQANRTHNAVGKEVRDTIKRLGGTMPEDLPTPKESIQQIEQNEKKRLAKGPQLQMFAEITELDKAEE